VDTSEDSEAAHKLDIFYRLDGTDLFGRSEQRGAAVLAPELEALRVIIDFGSALLRELPPPRTERRVRDMLVRALMRRALITAEAARLMLARGLHEPLVVLLRALLDVELGLRLVLGDETDRMALRLALAHYAGGQRHSQDMLSDPDVRALLEMHQGSTQPTVERARAFAEFANHQQYDAVRTEVSQSMYWHGYASAKAAFEAAGLKAPYASLYVSGSQFVHATNLEEDFTHVDGPTAHVRAFAQADVSRLRPPATNVALRLTSLIQAVADEFGEPGPAGRLPTPAELSEEGLPPDAVPLKGLTGLLHFVLREFGSEEQPKG
jgi:hypothetical protein